MIFFRKTVNQLLDCNVNKVNFLKHCIQYLGYPKSCNPPYRNTLRFCTPHYNEYPP
jgi:hypothetical protein